MEEGYGLKFYFENKEGKMNIIKKLFVFFVNVGWLVPLFYSHSILFDWLSNEVAPAIHGGNPTFSSLPILNYSRNLHYISFFWMSLVVIFWFFKFSDKKKNN